MKKLDAEQAIILGHVMSEAGLDNFQINSILNEYGPDEVPSEDEAQKILQAESKRMREKVIKERSKRSSKHNDLVDQIIGAIKQAKVMFDPSEDEEDQVNDILSMFGNNIKAKMSSHSIKVDGSMSREEILKKVSETLDKLGVDKKFTRPKP